MRSSIATLCLLLASTAASAAPAQQGPAADPKAAPKEAGQEAPVRLAPHRAVYDLSLARSGGARSVESVNGRIVVDFSGDACRGYAMQTRQVTVVESGESGDRSSDLRTVTFEAGDGRSLRFKTTSVLNTTASAPVDGTAESGSDGLKVKLKEPKRDTFSSEGEVLFPSHHMRRLIEAARRGQTTLSVKVFDGSDDGRKVYDTLAVIGHAAAAPAAAAKVDKPERDKPLREGAFADMRRWPVTLSYFTQGEGERTPIYTLTFELYENGVSGALHLDYGDFSIDGDMTRLDLAKESPKDEAKGNAGTVGECDR